MKRTALVLVFGILLIPSVARAECTGSCGSELLNSAKVVEKYVKKAWAAVRSCAKRGEPACPAACAIPDGTADPYVLGASCTGLIACELQAMAADVYGAQWDELGGCAAATADTCGNARAAAGKLVVKKLKRRRTSKMNKYPIDRDACVAAVDKQGACGGASVCVDAGSWIDSVVPIRLGKAGYQTLPFTAASDGEGKAVLSLLAESADWGTYGRESVVVEYDIDGAALGVIVVNDAELAADYPIMLGPVSAGAHTIGLRHTKLGPATDSPVRIEATASVSVLTASDPGHDALRFAPVLLGIDKQLNVIGSHPGNAISDVPLVEYARANPGVGMTTYTYVMIWSNEDKGTGIYPDVLIARYGRTTDIENIVEVDVSDSGALLGARFRPDESGTPAVFTGTYLFGTHPVVRTSTANGLIAQDGDSTLKFLLAPFEFDDSGVPRERGMDFAPHSYRVMAKEVDREAKTESVGKPLTTKLSDERHYLFVEYDISTDLDGRVLRAYAVVGGTAYGSDHYQPPVSVALDPKSIRGTAWTTIELPPGTTIADITAVGMQGVGTMSGTLDELSIFMLDGSYLPGPRTTFTGPVAASGLNPTWTIGP